MWEACLADNRRTTAHSAYYILSGIFHMHQFHKGNSYVHLRVQGISNLVYEHKTAVAEIETTGLSMSGDSNVLTSGATRQSIK